MQPTRYPGHVLEILGGSIADGVGVEATIRLAEGGVDFGSFCLAIVDSSGVGSVYWSRRRCREVAGQLATSYTSASPMAT
jgi:hypothetical protein